MNMKRGTIGFDIPVQKPNKKTQLEMTPEAVMKWRTLLPMADTGATAKKVYIALNELNHTAVPPKVRAEILNLFRPPLQLVCQGLRKHYINQTTALTKQKLTIANLAQTLQLEMANGYKTILEEMAEAKDDSDKELLAMSTYRAMHYFTLVLLRCYQLYSPAPKNLWREINLLYTHAEELKIVKHKIEGIVSTKDAQLTVSSAYAHTLLLAATNPYQWRQNDQEAINNTLDIWTPYATVRSASKGDLNKSGLYIIDTNEDKPPSPASLGKIELTKTCLILDVKKEVDHLEEILDEISADELKARMAHDGDPEYSVGAPILQRLYNDWKKVITRQHQRFQIKGTIKIAFGLSASHYYVSGEKDFNPQKQQQQTAASTSDEEDVFGGASSDLPTFDLDSDEESESISLTAEESEEENKEEISKKSNEFPIYTCALDNISPAGSCLMWEDEQSFPPIQAGEIVCFKNSIEGENAPWNIGVVRWLRHDRKGPLRAGLQLLASNGKSAGVQIIRGDTPAGYLLRCLVLPAMEDLNLESTIITPTLPFKSGKEVLITFPDKNEGVRASLDNQIDATGSYRQFEFSTDSNMDLIEEEEPQGEEMKTNDADKLSLTPEEKTETKDDDDEFGSIWGDL